MDPLGIHINQFLIIQILILALDHLDLQVILIK